MAGKFIAPLPGGEVLVDAVFADSSDVDVADVFGVVADDLGGVFAAAVRGGRQSQFHLGWRARS